MIAVIKYYKEIIIICLLFTCLFFQLKINKSNSKLNELKLNYDIKIEESKRKYAELLAVNNEEKNKSMEKYINEIITINDNYNDIITNNNRMQSEIKTYNDRLHTVTRETIENYAKTGSILYGECKKEYINLGQYTAKLDAELDSITSDK